METICMDIWSNIYAKQKKDFYLFIHILDIGILWHKYLYYELILLHHLQLFTISKIRQNISTFNWLIIVQNEIKHELHV